MRIKLRVGLFTMAGLLPLIEILLATGCTKTLDQDGWLREQVTYDGVVADITPVLRHTFRLKNPTGQRITIDKIDTDCSCTSAKIHDHAIEPYGLTTVDVTVRVPRTLGEPKVLCVVRLKGSSFKGWRLLTSFKCFPRIFVDPKDLEIQNSSPNHTKITQFVNVHVHGPLGNKEAISFTPLDGGMVINKVDQSERTVSSRLQHTVVKAKFSLDNKRLAELTRPSISFIANIGETHKEVFALKWKAMRNVVAAPQALHFGHLQKERATSRFLLIRPTEGELLDVENEEAEDNDKIKILISDNRRNGEMARLAVDAMSRGNEGSGKPNLHRGFLHLRVKLKSSKGIEFEEMSVPWTAYQ